MPKKSPDRYPEFQRRLADDVRLGGDLLNELDNKRTRLIRELAWRYVGKARAWQVQVRLRNPIPIPIGLARSSFSSRPPPYAPASPNASPQYPAPQKTTLQRLAVVMGDSPSDLADLIKAIPDPANKKFLATLSSKLQP